MKAIIRQAYQVFVRKLWGSPNFLYKETDREEACIEAFIKLLGKEYGLESVGRTLIYDYFCFQLNYWKDMDTRFGKKIPLPWFIGKKAFKRWLENPEEDLWHAHQTADEFEIHIDLIHTIDLVSVNSLELKQQEETEKRRYHNEDDALAHCLEFTTLYNHRSPECVTCKFKGECKKLLKANFFKLWIKRGYSEKNVNKAR